MNAIGHTAVADQFYAVSLNTLLQQIKVDPALRISFQDKAPRVPTLRDVMSDVLRVASERADA
jgi:hypothetical protein